MAKYTRFDSRNKKQRTEKFKSKNGLNRSFDLDANSSNKRYTTLKREFNERIALSEEQAWDT